MGLIRSNTVAIGSDGGRSRFGPAAVDVGETRQLTLNLNPGDNCFVVCGGAPARLLFTLSSFRSAVAAHGPRR